VLGLLKFSFRNTIVNDTRADTDISHMVPDLKTSYRDTTIELAVHGQIADGPALIASLCFFKPADDFHRLNLRRPGECSHIHRGKIGA
jgi:hypothetical protein